MIASTPLCLVPGEPQRKRPAGRLRHHRIQSPAGQPAAEEGRGLFPGEAQVVGGEDFGLTVQQRAGDVHAGGKLAARKGEVQVRRAAPQQEFK